MKRNDPPADAVSPVKPRSAEDARPPAAPRELTRSRHSERWFEINDEKWVARPSGKGAWGTGSYGLGLVDAVHFCRAEDPHAPVAEALLPHGRFDALYDEELAHLLAGAVLISSRTDG
ncbi:MAG: hypothetical protein WEF86_05500 [Gemmatimonadota bacterium]